jgi:hypothetical protein
MRSVSEGEARTGHAVCKIQLANSRFPGEFPPPDECSAILWNYRLQIFESGGWPFLSVSILSLPLPDRREFSISMETRDIVNVFKTPHQTKFE